VDKPKKSVSRGFLVTFVTADQIAPLVRRASAVSYPALCSVTASGLGRRPAASLLFCFDFIALRVTVSARNLIRKVRRKDFSGASANAELRHLGAGTRMASPGVTRAGSGNSTNGDKIMYQNKVNLIGFLGGDAEVRNANNRSFTTLSLATKSSYKDKKSGQYVAQTEWHRCVVFGRLSEFAGTLTKGAHIQVEGELRSREYDSKKTDSRHVFGRFAWIPF
jgi:single-strand DNA-binding protein